MRPGESFRLAFRLGNCCAFVSRLAVILSVAWPIIAAADQSAPPEGALPKSFKPEFDRDIRPILAENCYPCHGPDQNKRKAKLRLDRQEDAFKPLPNGDFAIVPQDTTR